MRRDDQEPAQVPEVPTRSVPSGRNVPFGDPDGGAEEEKIPENDSEKRTGTKSTKTTATASTTTATTAATTTTAIESTTSAAAATAVWFAYSKRGGS